MADPEKTNLTTQRVLIVLAVLVVLAMAGGNIVTSLNEWRVRDAEPSTGAPLPTEINRP